MTQIEPTDGIEQPYVPAYDGPPLPSGVPLFGAMSAGDYAAADDEPGIPFDALDVPPTVAADPAPAEPFGAFVDLAALDLSQLPPVPSVVDHGQPVDLTSTISPADSNTGQDFLTGVAPDPTLPALSELAQPTAPVAVEAPETVTAPVEAPAVDTEVVDMQLPSVPAEDVTPPSTAPQVAEAAYAPQVVLPPPPSSPADLLPPPPSSPADLLPPPPSVFTEGPVGKPIEDAPTEPGNAHDYAGAHPLEVQHDTSAPAGRPELERFLAGLVMHGGSDLHITHGEIPRYRVAGALLPVGGEQPLDDSDIERMLQEALNPRAWAEYQANGDVDTAYQMDQADGAVLTSRFRVNVYRSMGHIGAVMRVIPTKITTLDELGILPQVKRLAKLPRGLVLVCGPTGSGKSTTLAGLIDLINTTRSERVFTFEDPIEFTHSSKKCLISHREIGEDTPTFAEGLRRVRREDPDIILIGEMRDYETIDAAIEAADTGHLVLATLHTNSAPETISRIINSFPAERQEQVRITLSSVLMSVICQTLVPAPNTARGRVVASEIMMVNGAIRNNIRENDIPAIANALSDTTDGSISLDAHLAELCRQKVITRREAEKKATSPEALARYLGN